MLVVAINGAINAGKTTTGRALAAILPDVVFFDGDDHDAADDAPLELRIQASFAFLSRQIWAATAAVVIVAVPLRSEDVECIRATCAVRQADLFVVTLAPPLTVALSDRGGRALLPAETARIRQMYAQGYANRAFSDLILADMTTADDTARRICRHLGLSVRVC